MSLVTFIYKASQDGFTKLAIVMIERLIIDIWTEQPGCGLLNTEITPNVRTNWNVSVDAKF